MKTDKILNTVIILLHWLHSWGRGDSKIQCITSVKGQQRQNLKATNNFLEITEYQVIAN